MEEQDGTPVADEIIQAQAIEALNLATRSQTNTPSKTSNRDLRSRIKGASQQPATQPGPTQQSDNEDTSEITEDLAAPLFASDEETKSISSQISPHTSSVVGLKEGLAYRSRQLRSSDSKTPANGTTKKRMAMRGKDERGTYEIPTSPKTRKGPNTRSKATTRAKNRKGLEPSGTNHLEDGNTTTTENRRKSIKGAIGDKELKGLGILSFQPSSPVARPPNTPATQRPKKSRRLSSRKMGQIPNLGVARSGHSPSRATEKSNLSSVELGERESMFVDEQPTVEESFGKGNNSNVDEDKDSVAYDSNTDEEDDDGNGDTDEDQLIDVKLIKTFETTVSHIGCSSNSRGTEWYRIYPVPKKPKSSEGQRIHKGISQLMSMGTKPNREARLQIKKQCQSLVQVLKMSEEQSSTRKRDIAAIKKILIDVYFFILPDFSSVLKAISLAHSPKPDENNAALSHRKEYYEELEDFVRVVQNLLKASLDLPNEVQLERENHEEFQIKRPLMALNALAAELLWDIARKRAEILAAEKQMRLDAASKRLAIRRRKDEAEYARIHSSRIQKCHREQNRIMKERLKDPVLGPLLQANIDRELLRQERLKAEKEEENRMRKSGRVVQHFYWPTKVAMLHAAGKPSKPEIEYDPFSESFEDIIAPGKSRQRSHQPATETINPTENYERVEVFGKNNSRVGGEPRAWTDDEKSYFIDIMRTERDEDRFEIAAQDLDRSMEEIFAFARELQEAMDAAHEKGRMNREADAWTYSIWSMRKVA